MSSRFYNKNNRQGGWSLLEVLIGATLISVIVLALIGGLIRINDAGRTVLTRSVASFYLEEAVEALRFMSGDWDEYFSGLTSGVAYDAVWQEAENEWVLLEVGLDPAGGGFNRQLEFVPAYRDSSGRLSGSGSIDPDTWEVTATVSWQDRGQQQSESLNMILFNSYAGAGSN